MSAASITAQGRVAALALMVDTCTITRVTGETTDVDTGIVSKTLSTIYTGPCRIQQEKGVARPANVGEATVYQLPLTVQIPMSVTGVAVADVVTCVTSVLDVDLPGRKWWVRGLAHKTHATMRRLEVEEVTS